MVKVPVGLGNPPGKSNDPVMVTGTSVGEPADAVGAKPIVKKAAMHNAIAADKILFCRVTNILFFIFLIFCLLFWPSLIFRREKSVLAVR